MLIKDLFNRNCNVFFRNSLIHVGFSIFISKLYKHIRFIFVGAASASPCIGIQRNVLDYLLQNNCNVTFADCNAHYFLSRPIENIKGFSRETIIEVTTNIESQEQRRVLNNELGYAEHPRAAVTDDLETFFSITHRDLGNVFILKQFKEYWPKGVRLELFCLFVF